MRYRRVPKGTAIDVPAAPDDWQAYFSLELDSETGAFVVALNEAGTHLQCRFGQIASGRIEVAIVGVVPDFDGRQLLLAVADYQRRERRFGGLGSGHATP